MPSIANSECPGTSLCGVALESGTMYENIASERGVEMAGNSSDRVFRQVHRVLNLGAVGMMPDAQLLEWFVSERDQSAEAAFEELMNRHGPMVFGVCRRVLHDPHDAEDAYQAAFLVLAKRAGSIRQKHSVASWLFGVAHRVAIRARGRAARRRATELRIAEQTAGGFSLIGGINQLSARDDNLAALSQQVQREQNGGGVVVDHVVEIAVEIATVAPPSLSKSF